MIQEKLSALPVFNELNKLVGVITHQSVIQTLTKCGQDCHNELRSLRIQFEDQEQKARTCLAQLNKTLKDLTTKQGLDLIEVNLLQLGIEALTTLLQVRYGAIGVLDELDESGASHKYFCHNGIPPEMANSIGRLPEGHGLLGKVTRENVTINLEDITKDSQSVGFPPHHPLMKSLLAVPISSENRVYGRIYLSEKLNGLPFNEEKEKLVQNFSTSLATALNESFRIAILVREKALQLELTSKYKSEFLANMSHELRTPLNNLLMLSELLKENKSSHLDVKEVEFAQLIHASGNDLLSLINEILDLSKIESGRVSLNFSELPFAQLHDQIESVFRHVAENRILDFEVTFASDLPPAIITDEMRLLQVIKNLLSNAFKFTEKGQVSLRVNRATSGWSTENKSLNKADEVFAFTIEDTGLGISADQQSIIFEAFQQGDGATMRKYGGTGLGLSISREIAKLLGGELTLVRSAPQQGSTFVLYVPLHSVHDDSLTPISESGQTLPCQEQSNLDGKKILIVDDDARNIFALSAALERRGVVVSSAENGATAIDLLTRAPDTDLVLMDIMMPEMDGYETMREIRKLKEFKNLPIIALTANAMVGDREKCLEAGASDYLSKPVNIAQLSSLMQVWLSK